MKKNHHSQLTEEERVGHNQFTPKPRPGRIRRFIRLCLVFFVLGAIIFISGGLSLANKVFEDDPPLVSLIEGELLLGLESKTLNLTLSDAGAGLDELSVKVEQAGKTSKVVHKTYEFGVSQDSLQLKLDPKELHLKEGRAEFQISVFDKSFWSNGTRLRRMVLIDFEKPEVFILPDHLVS